ncbi:MAG: 50S ribosomal protein L25 [Spirochaetota bacterium]
MKEHVLNIKIREKTGKEEAKKLRQRGYIPAVIYGRKGNRIVAVKAKEFEKVFDEIGEHSIINLRIDEIGNKEVIIKDFQLDPVRRNIIHIDFLEFELDKLLKTEVPIKILGISKGVKKGGILETFVRDLEIECLPRNIPDFIPINIDELDIGDSIHVRDIKTAEGIRIVDNPDQVVITIGTPTKVEIPVVEVAAAPAEAAAPVEEKVAGEEEKKEAE